MIPNYTDLYKKTIVAIIKKHLPNTRIILYGSRARKDFRSGADIDVALDCGDIIDELAIAKIQYDLEESSVPVYCDIVDYQRVSQAMQNNIVKDGVIWMD